MNIKSEKVSDFNAIHVAQAGNSAKVELAGLKSLLTSPESRNVNVSSLTTDRNLPVIVGPPALPSPLSYKVWVFKIFEKKGGSDFFLKKGGVGKKGGITYFHTNQPFPELSFWVFGMSVFYLFTSFLSVLFACHRKNLLLFHLINRYGSTKWIIFEKKRHCWK